MPRTPHAYQRHAGNSLDFALNHSPRHTGHTCQSAPVSTTYPKSKRYQNARYAVRFPAPCRQLAKASVPKCTSQHEYPKSKLHQNATYAVRLTAPCRIQSAPIPQITMTPKCTYASQRHAGRSFDSAQQLAKAHVPTCTSRHRIGQIKMPPK